MFEIFVIIFVGPLYFGMVLFSPRLSDCGKDTKYKATFLVLRRTVFKMYDLKLEHKHHIKIHMHCLLLGTYAPYVKI